MRHHATLTAFRLIALLCLTWAAAPVDAVDEAAYTPSTYTLAVPSVALDGSSYYDIELTLTSPSAWEFTLTKAVPTSVPGAAYFSSGSLILDVPSLTIPSAGAGGLASRYAAEFILTALTPALRFQLLSATQNTTAYAESSEAQKVAAWVRELDPVSNASNHFGLWGPLYLSYMDTPQSGYMKSNGPAAFFSDTNQVAAVQRTHTTKLGKLGPVAQAGGLNWTRHPLTLPWGMTEISQGQYDASIADHLIGEHHAYSLDYVADVQPFASWDLASRAASTSCSNFLNGEFTFLAKEGKMDKPVHMDLLALWLYEVVERYDGDGLDDMPGLFRPIRYYQIHNEPDLTSTCGSYQDDVAGYFDLLKTAYTAIKAASPDCQVLNGGAGDPDPTRASGQFWTQLAQLGGTNYVDILALHYNSGKHSISNGSAEEFETWIANLKAALGGNKPLWVTEFGVMVNIQSGGAFYPIGETNAAAWFVRMYATGLANGVAKFFSDPDPFINVDATGGYTILQLPYYVNKMMEYLLGGFTAATKLASGQYRFTVGGKNIYVLWSGVPAALTGTVVSYDLYGNARTNSASALSPAENAPLIVAPVAWTNWVKEGKLMGETSSTCTLVESNLYRMYIATKEAGGFASVTSTDGRSFTNQQNTGISGQASPSPEFLVTNPSIVKRPSGLYVMLYEGNNDMTTDDTALGTAPKFFRATSSNGIAFTRYAGALTNNAVLIPEAAVEGTNTAGKYTLSVPDMITFNNTLYLYYAANRKIFVATSDNDGQTWTKLGRVAIAGVADTDSVVDPDVNLMADGRLLLLFTHAREGDMYFGTQGLACAFSSDGVNFTLEGTAVTRADLEDPGDPDAVPLLGQTDKFRVYYGMSVDPDNRNTTAPYHLYSATSP